MCLHLDRTRYSRAVRGGGRVGTPFVTGNRWFCSVYFIFYKVGGKSHKETANFFWWNFPLTLHQGVRVCQIVTILDIRYRRHALIPTKSGVCFGFSCYRSLTTVCDGFGLLHTGCVHVRELVFVSWWGDILRQTVSWLLSFDLIVVICWFYWWGWVVRGKSFKFRGNGNRKYSYHD